jgi:hypothetical protein
MNRLQLVQRAHQESGLSGNAPASTLNQSGMAAKMVNWVDAAWEDIQNDETNWRFNHGTSGGALTSGDDTYDPVVDWSITAEPARWVQDDRGSYVYRPADGLASRLFMRFLPWEQFRGINIPLAGGQPLYWTVKPDGDIAYHPRPNASGFTTVHEFYMANQVLAADADIPRAPERFHLAIVWRAVMKYAGHDGATDLYQVAAREEGRYMDRMRSSELPQMGSPGALA